MMIDELNAVCLAVDKSLYENDAHFNQMVDITSHSAPTYCPIFETMLSGGTQRCALSC